VPVAPTIRGKQRPRAILAPPRAVRALHGSDRSWT
jgi:hypothetical protein